MIENAPKQIFLDLLFYIHIYTYSYYPEYPTRGQAILRALKGCVSYILYEYYFMKTDM